MLQQFSQFKRADVSVLASLVCLITGLGLGGHFYTAGPGQFGGAITSSVATVLCLCCFLFCPSRPFPKTTTLALAILALMSVIFLERGGHDWNKRPAEHGEQRALVPPRSHFDRVASSR
jgi:hypothetical protein